MSTRLEALGDALASMLQPANFLQVSVIFAAVLLGWWAARYVRARIAV
jgi:hypothetical protein